MDAITQTEKQEKAMRLLANIAECERLIEANKKDAERCSGKHGKNWFNQRVEINTKIKDRLQNYYDKSLKI